MNNANSNDTWSSRGERISRVALITMPWNSIRRGAIPLGILKALLKQYGIASDILYLNIRMAKLMRSFGKLLDYEALGEAHLLGEWLFSQHLFGKYGSGELNNSYSDLINGSWQDLESTVGVKQLLEHRNFDFEKISEEIIPGFIEECLNEVSWQQYKIVGFSSVFNQHVASLLLAKKIKERHPDIKVVFGGSNVHSVMGQATIKAFEWIDYVVDGEGEPVFPSLVKNILDDKPFEQLPGVSYRRGEEVFPHKDMPPMYHLDEAPFPDYTEYFEELERCSLSHVDNFILFESSRGCWWGEKAHCTFCGLNGQSMKYRAKSGQKIVEEILSQSNKYKRLLFYSVDNILDLESFTDLLPALAEKELDLELFYEVKSNLNDNQVELLDAAGIKYIQPGVESLHTEILKLMKKGVTAIQNLQLLKFCRARGIHANWNILYGFPGEKRYQYEQINETLSLISHLQPPVGAGRIILQRFSPYHFDADRLGIRNLKPASLYYHIYPKHRVNLEEIAYYFDYTLDDSAEDPEDYIKPVKDTIDTWKRAYQDKKIYLRYRKGAGFIELQDNRPLEGFEPGLVRKTVLKGIESDVYLLCDSIKSFSQINDFVKARTYPAWSDQQVKALLDRFILHKLIFEEKGRYLALATAARPKKASASFKANQAGLSASVAASAASSNTTRTLKVLDVVAGTMKSCGEQMDGAVG